MSNRFEVCHPVTAKWEGGWSDHPADPGGKTMYGVTETRWHEYQRKMGMPLTPVKNITFAQALKFYHSEYWDAINADSLFPGVDLATYDASVNSGVSRGRKWLFASIGSKDHSETVRKICKARLAFVKGLATWKTFGKGWSNRIVDIEAKGVVMALEAMKKTKAEIVTVVEGHAAKAEADAKAANTQSQAAGAGAATPAVVATQVDVMTVFDWIVVGGVTLGFIAAVLWLINTRRENEARAASYKAVLA